MNECLRIVLNSPLLNFEFLAFFFVPGSFPGGFSPKESIYDEVSSTIASELPLKSNEFIAQKPLDGKESVHSFSSLDTFSIKLCV
jgi:hypothetical protein